jgi:hypothetical protein
MIYLVGSFFKTRTQRDDGGWIQVLVDIVLVIVMKGKTWVITPPYVS